MNQSQIHLALTHLPVVLTITGMVMLILSLARKNQSLTKTSFYILIAAGLLALPVFFSGKGAEEIVEELPGVSESIIERHESFAQVSLTLVIAAGLIAITGLFKIAGKPLMNIITYPLMVVVIASSISLGYTAHLGGQVRHTEIQTASNQNGGGGENGESNTTESADEKDHQD
jgi:uncharacterized membrane protein